MSVRLRHHALQRAALRTSMTEDDVQHIINRHLCVTLGYEPNSQRAHKLFWSHLDQDCFVAVVDERAQEVITILPMAYENRFRMSMESVEMARALWDKHAAASAPPATASHPTPHAAPHAPAWHLGAQVIEPCGALKMKNLGRFSPPTASHDARARILRDHLDACLHQRDIPWPCVTYIRAKLRSGDVHVLYRNRWAETAWAHGLQHPAPLDKLSLPEAA